MALPLLRRTDIRLPGVVRIYVKRFQSRDGARRVIVGWYREPRALLGPGFRASVVKRGLMSDEPTFKELNRVMQELVREQKVLREHNMAQDPKDQSRLLLMAEGAVTLLVLEHFLRIIHPSPRDSDSLPALLQQVVDARVVEVADAKAHAKTLGMIRGALQHGNFTQRARQLGLTVEAYFGDRFAKEIEELYHFTDYLARQIDTRTGKPVRLRLNPLTIAERDVTTRSDGPRRRRRPKPPG